MSKEMAAIQQVKNDLILVAEDVSNVSAGVNSLLASAYVIPANLFLLTDTATPTGTTIDTTLDGYLLQCNTTKGVTSKQMTTTNAGTHSHTVNGSGYNYDSALNAQNAAGGGHVHTWDISTATGYTAALPKHKSLRLCKVTSDLAALPIGAIFLHEGVDNPFTDQVDFDDSFIMISATADVVGGQGSFSPTYTASVTSCTTNTAGNHTHGSLNTVRGTSSFSSNNTSRIHQAEGNHLHNNAYTIDFDISYAARNIYRVTRTTPGIVGMLGFWDYANGGLPEGWLLCDGTLGTPDLIEKHLVGKATEASVALSDYTSALGLSNTGEVTTETAGAGGITHDHQIVDSTSESNSGDTTGSAGNSHTHSSLGDIGAVFAVSRLVPIIFSV